MKVTDMQSGNIVTASPSSISHVVRYLVPRKVAGKLWFGIMVMKESLEDNGRAESFVLGEDDLKLAEAATSHAVPCAEQDLIPHLTAIAVMKDLVSTVEATGGIIPNPETEGTFVPDADHDWVDMADVYLKACKVLGIKPMARGKA